MTQRSSATGQKATVTSWNKRNSGCVHGKKMVFTKQMVKCWSKFPRDNVESPSLEILNTVRGPELCARWPCLEGWTGIYGCPIQAELFYYSVILWPMETSHFLKRWLKARQGTSRASGTPVCFHGEVHPFCWSLCPSMSWKKKKRSLPALLICPSLFPAKLFCVSRSAFQRRCNHSLQSKLWISDSYFGEVGEVVLPLLLPFCNLPAAQE